MNKSQPTSLLKTDEIRKKEGKGVCVCGGGGDNSLATFVDLAYDRAEREPLANYRCRLFYYDWSVSQTFDGTALLIACRWGRRSPTFIINYPKKRNKLASVQADILDLDWRYMVF